MNVVAEWHRVERLMQDIDQRLRMSGTTIDAEYHPTDAAEQSVCEAARVALLWTLIECRSALIYSSTNASAHRLAARIVECIDVFGNGDVADHA